MKRIAFLTLALFFAAPVFATGADTVNLDPPATIEQVKESLSEAEAAFFAEVNANLETLDVQSVESQIEDIEAERFVVYDVNGGQVLFQGTGDLSALTDGAKLLMADGTTNYYVIND